MITIMETKIVNDGKSLVELACSSSDTKPTEYMNGSMCIEVDTGNIYIFDEENSEWNAIGSSGGDDSSDDEQPDDAPTD